MDKTTWEHAGIALAICVVGYFTGNSEFAAGLSIGIFLGREHSQAEYRIIESKYGGLRANMKWYGGFEHGAWNLDSLIDLLAPTMVAVTFLAGLKFIFEN